MNLQIGHYYKTRGGKKAKYIYFDYEIPSYPIIATIERDIVRLTTQGCFYGPTVPGTDDLISEWFEKPTIDRSILPAWANKAVALSSNGTWYCFSVVPEITDNNHWDREGDYRSVIIPTTHIPKWTGNWKDSLITFED